MVQSPLPYHIEELEGFVSAYIEQAWEEGRPQSEAQTLVAALQFFLRRRRILPVGGALGGAFWFLASIYERTVSERATGRAQPPYVETSCF